jgi:hypothetical protein
MLIILEVAIASKLIVVPKHDPMKIYNGNISNISRMSHFLLRNVGLMLIKQ